MGKSTTAKLEIRVHNLTFTPFFRLDSSDGERTHLDIRELLWQSYGDTWEVRAGLGKVFWGVTESQYLVDVINQTDLVESPDGEDRLRKLPRQVDTLQVDSRAVFGLGKNVRGGTRPRLSCGRSSL